MKYNHLLFKTSIGKAKPNSIRNKETSCPFCATDQLTGIIDMCDSIILLKNKYPVLEDTFQTVLIETDDCHGEISTYSSDHLIKLINFGIKHWLAMEESGEYQSVIFFKNHGPLSGGSIAHPHMQIIGLKTVDYKEKVQLRDFEGYVIQEKEGVVFSVSNKPKIGFTEFNVKMNDIKGMNQFASFIQVATHYTLHAFPYRCSSYNIFFYHMGEDIFAKIVPRFITTPIYIGYSIPQIPDNLEWMVEDIQSKYFSEVNKGREIPS
ncbi:DUF4931 domain-containing protein [Bacillus massilinigeriensis]|uniref:DUF4931 domain-containing protein n=1 Tax=Bacillus massilionigeriensis TaxID=1805475 RepID=UPI00096B28AF|nr:DUF4931 domain-containing protein [Bacillus massilionigeriensis]